MRGRRGFFEVVRKTEVGENVCEERMAMVSLVLIERDGRRRPVCCLCRRAKDGEEPKKAGEVFICGGCMERVREESKEYNVPLGRPRKRRSV